MAASMRVDEDALNWLSIWQTLHFKKCNGNPRENADCLRGQMHQLSLSRRSKALTSTTCATMFEACGLEYQKVLDSADAVNNYEEEVLEAIKLKRSEKDQWKSALSAESVLNLDCVVDFLAKNVKDSTKSNYEEERNNNFLDSLKCESTSTSKRPLPVKLEAQVPKHLLPSKRKLDDVYKGDQKPQPFFQTARERLVVDAVKKYGTHSAEVNALMCGAGKKSLGCTGIRKNSDNLKFVAPLANRTETNCHDSKYDLETDERLKNIDQKMVEMITNEIMNNKKLVTWDDIAGLEFVKKMVKEMVVLPMIRPDFCTRLRCPPKGLLLFGPPGTGKTLIGKVIASVSNSTFFSISASSLTSKWIGEGEKMVRALFAVAKCHQPAVIFIDEIDSLLTQRNDSEHEASRRMKTEFLVQLDGTATHEDDRILVVGATNRPQELDEAARRRLAKKLYIPLPDLAARKQIINSLVTGEKHSLSEDHIADIATRSEGYSGADMANVCKEAAYGPIRGLSFEEMETIPTECVRPILHQDFLDALSQVKASVSESDLQAYDEWNKKFGSTSHL